MGNIFHQCPKGKDISGKKEANFSRTIITNFGSVVDHEKYVSLYLDEIKSRLFLDEQPTLFLRKLNFCQLYLQNIMDLCETF